MEGGHRLGEARRASAWPAMMARGQWAEAGPRDLEALVHRGWARTVAAAGTRDVSVEGAAMAQTRTG